MTKATIKASQEQMRTEITTGLEEMKATKTEASQEKIDAAAERH